jgi:hypothetical protein
MPITHDYTIICDDVRREDNGKLIVLGMYMGTITVPMLPFVFPTLTVLSLFHGEKPESWSWRLSIQNLENNSQVIAEARGFATVPAPGPGIMPVKFTGLPITQAGAYQIVLEREGDREPLAFTPINIVLTPQVVPGQVPGQSQFPRR